MSNHDAEDVKRPTHDEWCHALDLAALAMCGGIEHLGGDRYIVRSTLPKCYQDNKQPLEPTDGERSRP